MQEKDWPLFILAYQSKSVESVFFSLLAAEISPHEMSPVVRRDSTLCPPGQSMKYRLFQSPVNLARRLSERLRLAMSWINDRLAACRSSH